MCFYAAYRGPLSHIIAYHEQHQLFLFTKAYFEHQVHSEGFFSYLTNFLIQFFYFPLFGSAILAALIASTFLLTHALFRKIIGEEDWLCLSIFSPFFSYDGGKPYTYTSYSFGNGFNHRQHNSLVLSSKSTLAVFFQEHVCPQYKVAYGFDCCCFAPICRFRFQSLCEKVQ